jgi:hypothetical protein
MKFLAWIGTAASIAGSYVVAMQIFLLGYCFFTVGSVAWLLVGLHRKDKALCVLNGAFAGANILGLYNVFVV